MHEPVENGAATDFQASFLRNMDSAAGVREWERDELNDLFRV